MRTGAVCSMKTRQNMDIGGWLAWLVHFLGQSATMVFLTGLLTAAQYIKSPFALYLTMRASNMIAQFCFTISLSHKEETHRTIVLGADSVHGH